MHFRGQEGVKQEEEEVEEVMPKDLPTRCQARVLIPPLLASLPLSPLLVNLYVCAKLL